MRSTPTLRDVIDPPPCTLDVASARVIETENGSFDVFLDHAGDGGVFVLAAIRHTQPMPLRSAKACVQNLPVRLLHGVERAEAREAYWRVVAVGGSASIWTHSPSQNAPFGSAHDGTYTR